VFVGEFAPDITGADIFTSDELADNARNNTPIVIVEKSIFIDDSIYAIKLKLASAIQLQLLDIAAPAIEEMYFWAKTNKRLNPSALFDKHQRNGVITGDTLTNIVMNISNMSEYEVKDEYTHEDMIQMFNPDTDYVMDISIGQQSKSVYPANPVAYRTPVISQSRVSHILLEYPPIEGNHLYVYFADDLLEMGMDNIISAYYPALYDDGHINKLKQSDATKLRNATKRLHEGSKDTFDKISMFNELYRQRTTEIEYRSKGIKTISITITPDYAMKIPIDVIFKLIHADQDRQLIKYNFSSKQDNIYRLFVDKITKTGDKIPHLPKATIFKLMKNIGKTKSVAIYSKLPQYEFVCELAALI